MTKVVFKKIGWFNEDEPNIVEINAIFTEEIEAVINGQKHYLGYAHIGQHTEIHEDFLRDGKVGKHTVETATKEEYSELYRELVSLGYELEVV